MGTCPRVTLQPLLVEKYREQSYNLSLQLPHFLKVCKLLFSPAWTLDLREVGLISLTIRLFSPPCLMYFNMAFRCILVAINDSNLLCCTAEKDSIVDNYIFFTHSSVSHLFLYVSYLFIYYSSFNAWALLEYI